MKTFIWAGMRRAAAIGAVLMSGAAMAGPDVRLQGAGATFPNPLYQKWVGEFGKVHAGVQIDYGSIGSGGGIKAITEKTVDFAGSDAPMSRKELEAAGGAAKIVQVPSCAGADVPAFNLPGIKDLNFTGEVLAQIFMGKIARWNDEKLAALNPGVRLPDTAITPAWRTDGSGTTYLWTCYLATQSEEYKSTIGTGKQVKWPVGQGGKGNEGVAAAVQNTTGAIGYIELNYALANKISFGAVKNQAGKFVKASGESVTAAGEGAVDKMSGQVLAADIWNQPGENAYPISSFTYLIVYKDLSNVKSKDQAQALADFLWWATHDGQYLAGSMDYAPLSKGVQAKVETALTMLRYKGEKLTIGGSK